MEVKHITEEELSKYTIFDVVMPLPGLTSIYPSNLIGERFREMLAADGLDIGNMKQSQRWGIVTILLQYSFIATGTSTYKEPTVRSWSSQKS